jgi:DeoR family fructose operon transcriptional repressor
MEVHLLGGRFLQRQSILLGDTAQRSARAWNFDIVFLGAEGVNARGIWSSKPEVAAFQRALVTRAKKVIVCAHAAKLGRATGIFLSPWNAKFHLVTDASPAQRARHGLPL